MAKRKSNSDVGIVGFSQKIDGHGSDYVLILLAQSEEHVLKFLLLCFKVSIELLEEFYFGYI